MDCFNSTYSLPVKADPSANQTVGTKFSKNDSAVNRLLPNRASTGDADSLSILKSGNGSPSALFTNYPQLLKKIINDFQ